MDDKRPARVGAGRDERWDERRAWTAGLLAEARAGRTEALAELVPELSPMLWHVARSAGLSAADAEDVVQQAWLRLVSHLDQLSQPGSVASWLVTTTRREAWRRRSAGRRQFPAEQDWLAGQPDQDPDAAEQAVLDEERRELWAALAQLSPGASSCCGSSRSCRARTTTRSRPGSASRGAASARPAAGAWPSSVPF